jgi:two-component system response regulator LytT
VRIAIVEDEAVVARRLERMIRAVAGAEVRSLAHAATLEEARALVNDGGLDVLVLDLGLNGKDGFLLLEEASAARFQTIVVSARHDEALRAFDYGVADFVPKPFGEERLRKALDRARGRVPGPRPRARVLAVRAGREVRPVPVERVVFVRGADDFSELHLDDGATHLHARTLAELARLLPETFVRVHRSYVADLSRARGLRGRELVLRGGWSVPVGRTYRPELLARLGLAAGETPVR